MSVSQGFTLNQPIHTIVSRAIYGRVLVLIRLDYLRAILQPDAEPPYRVLPTRCESKGARSEKRHISYGTCNLPRTPLARLWRMQRLSNYLPLICNTDSHARTDTDDLWKYGT
jgi:hypothetical protein